MTERVALVVYINPPAGPRPADEVGLELVRNVLGDHLTPYNLVVAHAPESVPRPEPRRKAYIVYVDLDERSEMMRTRRLAHNVVRAIVRDRIPHFNPVVSYALAPLQPTNTEGNTEA